MAADAELTRLIAEKAAVQRAIDQIEADNTVSGSFGDVSVRRNELAELNRQRDRINVRIRMRQAQLLKMGSPIWNSHIRATRQRPEELDETGLTPSGGGATPETPPSIIVPSHPVHPGTHNRYIGWSDDTMVNVGELIGAAVFTSDVMTIPSRSVNGYLWFSVDEDPGYPDSLAFQGNPTNQLPFYLEQMGPLHLNGVDYVVGLNPNLLSPANLVGKTITLGYVS